MRKTTVLFSLLLLAMAAGAGAQEREREREQRRLEELERDIREAEARLAAAQRELSEALQSLREEDTEEITRLLDDALRELQRAQSDLWRSRVGESLLRIREGVVDITTDPEGREGVVFTLSRPKMGVIVATERRAETDSLGALLTAVTPGGPADEAGLEEGDIILSVNGESLARLRRRDKSPGDRLIEIVREAEEGDTLRVEYRRGGERRTTDVVLRELDEDVFAYGISGDSVAFEEPRIEIIRVPRIGVAPRVEVLPEVRALVRSRLGISEKWLDMELVELNPELGGYFGADEGVLVVEAPEDEALQLRSGDVILSIDGRRPRSPSHAMRILRSYSEGESLEIEVMRNKKRVTLSVTVPEDEDAWDRGRDELRERGVRF